MPPDAAAFVGFPWGGATVHVPIELIGNGLGRNAGGSTPLLDLKPSFFHSKGLTILEQTTGHDLVLEDGTLVPASAEAAESSDLENPSVALEGIDHSPAFGHESRHGLFAENVHPGFCAGNGYAGVPVGWSCNGDQVKVLAFKQTAEVLINLGLPFAPGIGESLGAVEVDVAGSDKLNFQSLA